jgi:hypothetical protein
MAYEKKIDLVLIDFKGIFSKNDFFEELILENDLDKIEKKKFDEKIMEKFSLKNFLNYYILKSRPQKGMEKVISYLQRFKVKTYILTDEFYFGAYIYKKLYFDDSNFELIGDFPEVYSKDKKIKLNKHKIENLVLKYLEKNRNHKAFTNYYFNPLAKFKDFDFLKIFSIINDSGISLENTLYITSLKSNFHQKILERKGLVAGIKYDDKNTDYANELKTRFNDLFLDFGSINNRRDISDVLVSIN